MEKPKIKSNGLLVVMHHATLLHSPKLLEYTL